MEKLKKFALVTGIVASAAVVVSVAFLAIEMRGNTNAVQAISYQVLMQEMNEYRMAFFTNPKQASEHDRLARKAHTDGWESLTLPERARLWTPISVRWGIYESAFFANKRGILGREEWARFERNICIVHKSDKHFWNPDDFQKLTDILTVGFVTYVEELCNQPNED